MPRRLQMRIKCDFMDYHYWCKMDRKSIRKKTFSNRVWMRNIFRMASMCLYSLIIYMRILQDYEYRGYIFMGKSKNFFLCSLASLCALSLYAQDNDTLKSNNIARKQNTEVSTMPSTNQKLGFANHEVLKRQEILLVGLSVRTNNKQEVNKLDGKIFPLIRKYFHEAPVGKIPHRKTPGTTYCAYTDYESDEHGDYTYFIGEEVTSFDGNIPEGFQTLRIPAQTYAKFTTNSDPMPDVLLKAWKTIWSSSPSDLGGKRTYTTDFELYDERAADHQNIVLDLYIAINAKNL